MAINPRSRAYIELHLAVFLFGFTAILGDLINLPAYVIVWWRVLITSSSFLLIIRNWSFIRSLSRTALIRFSVIGVLIGLHWVFFFGAVKFANASITLICMATTSLFTSFIEPVIFKKRLVFFEVFIGLIVIPAMLLIISDIRVEMRIGVLFGLCSAFLAALFNTLNKKHLIASKEKEITFWELTSAWLFLSILLPCYAQIEPLENFLPSGTDWLYLVILAALCTTFAFTLAMRALNHISAFGSSLTLNLEPIYGILLSILLLKEHKELDASFYVGAAVIIASVTFYPLIMNKRKSK